MGYKTNSQGIISFWPDDGEDIFYIPESESLSSIQERIGRKWPDVDPKDISISSIRLQTDCIGYDLYDPCDWTFFLRIERLKP